MAALSGPRLGPASPTEPACDGLGMNAPVLASLRGEDAQGGEKRTEPSGDVISLHAGATGEKARLRQRKLGSRARFSLAGLPMGSVVRTLCSAMWTSAFALR